MLVVGYPERNLNRYDRAYHVGAGRIREEVEEEFSANGDLMIQADGHELEAIREQFSGIPMATARIVRWTGETARFIVTNINL